MDPDMIRQIKLLNQSLGRGLRNISSPFGLLGSGVPKAMDLDGLQNQLAPDSLFQSLQKGLQTLGGLTTGENRDKTADLARMMGYSQASQKIVSDRDGHHDGLQYTGIPLRSLEERWGDTTPVEFQGTERSTQQIEQIQSALKDATVQGKALFGAVNSGSREMGGQISSLKSCLDDLTLTLTQAILPSFQMMVSRLSCTTQWFDKLSESTKSTLGYLVEWSALVTPISKLMEVFGGIATAIRSIELAFSSNALGAVLSLTAVGVSSFLSYRDREKNPGYQNWLASPEGQEIQKKYQNSEIYEPMSQSILGHREKAPLEYYQEKKYTQEEERMKTIHASLEKQKNAFVNKKIDHNIHLKLSGDVQTDSEHIKKVLSDVLNNESAMTSAVVSQRRLELGLTQ